MPKWESTEAPLSVTVDDPEAYSGHMDDKPVKVAVDGDADAVGYSGDRMAPSVLVSMSPAEAYHFVDDLHAAADSCWGAAEFVVTAHTPNRGQRYVGTIKAPSEADAVRRVVDMLEATVDADAGNEQDFQRLTAAREAERFTVYRADSGSLVSPDELTDDTNDNEENHD